MSNIFPTGQFCTAIKEIREKTAITAISRSLKLVAPIYWYAGCPGPERSLLSIFLRLIKYQCRFSTYMYTLLFNNVDFRHDFAQKSSIEAI